MDISGSAWRVACVLLCVCVWGDAHQAGKGRGHVRVNMGLDDFDTDDELGNQLNRNEFVENKEHIKEHLEDEAKVDLDDMSDEELEFYFFKIHDSNGDNLLDGIELLHAISHGLDEQVEKVQKLDISAVDKKKRIERMTQRQVEMVDKILKEDDLNHDGYVDYVEFEYFRKSARRKMEVLNEADKLEADDHGNVKLVQ